MNENTEQINIKLTKEDLRIFRELKRVYAINAAQFIKNCLRRKYEQLKKQKDIKL